jgi:hypothetical protein
MLVPCKQCGTSVSDQAERCPKCGLERPANPLVEVQRRAPGDRNWVVPLLVVAALSVGVVGFGAYEMDRRASADWQDVDVHSEASIRRFISTHPIRVSRDAEAALARVEIEQQRYLAAMASNNVANLESYLQEFPDGHRAPLVRARIGELRRPPPDPCSQANVDWNSSMNQSCEIWDLQIFISEVDRSCPVRALAQSRLQALRRAQEWQGIPGSWSVRPRLTGCVYN